MADIKYVISVDAKGATTGIREFDATVDGLGKTSKTTEGHHDNLFKKIFGGVTIANLATKGLSLLWNELKAFPGAAIEAEKADKALDAAIEITGRRVPGLTQHFKDYASELQKQTIYDDEAIKGAQTLLVQLTNLDKNGLDRATKGAIGLASVMGMDLESAASLVAKAMSGNTAMLSRYGIQVDQTKSKEDQRVEILTKLEQFYGRATAETETYGGKLAMLKNKYGEVQEAVGGYITKNHALMNSLNAVADAILFQLTLNDRLAKSKQSVEDKENEWSESLAKASAEAGLQYGAMAKLITAYNGNTVALARAISQGKEGLALQQALKKVRTEEIHQYEDLRKKQAELEKGTNKFADETKKATKAAKTYQDLLYEAPGAYRQTKVAIEEMIPTCEAADKVIIKLGVSFGKMNKISTNSMLDWSQDTIDKFNQVMAATMQFTQGVGDLFQALTDRKIAALDKEYQAQVYAIEQSKMSEEEKNIALSKLAEEHEAKSEAVRIAGAKKQKKISYLMAVMDAAGAIVNALNTHPFIPAGLIAAATAAIMGGLQVATIASTPLAKGGIFNQPTLLAGGRYEVAEAGEKEVVAPLSGLKRELGIHGSGAKQVIHNYIYLDGKLMKEFIVDTAQSAASTGRLKIDRKAVA
jgi:hypothetical protein